MGTKIICSKNDNVESVVSRPPCDEENNEAPDEIRIVKNELNDSFEPDLNEIKSKARRKKKPFQLHNHKDLVNSLASCQSPKLSPKNQHIRFDESGEPVLNLRPQVFGGHKPVVVEPSIIKGVIDVNNSVEEDGEEPFTLVKSIHKRKKRLQKLDSNGSENEVIGTKVSRNSFPPTNSVADAQILNRDSLNNVTSTRIKKYWAQRYRLFSKYDQGILMDEESWYSVTPEKIARHIAEVMRCGIVVDGFCGVGGNAIQFALTCDRVIAVDIDINKINMARNNARVYGVEHKIEFIVGDFFQVVPHLVADAIFLSPPWGGPEYLRQRTYDLHQMGNQDQMDGFDVFSAAQCVTPNIAFFVPRNTPIPQLSSLGKVKVEKNVVNHKIKTVTAYYGNLSEVDR